MKSSDLLGALSAAQFSVEHGHLRLADLPQPSWVNSDEVRAEIQLDPTTVWIEIRFEHHRTIRRYGSDSDTILGMKKMCAEEWFPELEQHFEKLADYYNLDWRKDADVDDPVIPVMSYSLAGEFPSGDADRVLSLLLEVRTILSHE